MPFSYGDAVIHLSRVAAAVAVDAPLVEVPSAPPTDIERRIGNHIAELIPDGATLQSGVGGIPNAVLAALTGLGAGELATLLIGLELSGAVRQLPGNRYMKTL